MSKFTKTELKKSLINNITLLEKGEESIWAEFHEIKGYLELGYFFVNEEKAELYKKLR